MYCPFQVADVTKPLISVAQLSAAGNTCVFDKHGGRIVNRSSGKQIPLDRIGNSYCLTMLVREEAKPGKATTFARPGP